MTTNMITLTPSERELIEESLKENEAAKPDLDAEIKEAEAEIAAETKTDTAEPEPEKKPEPPPEYEIQSVFSGPDPAAKVQEAIEMNRRALGNLKKQFDDGKISEEEFDAQGKEMASAIQRAETHLNAVQAYRQESFRTETTRYCEEHAAVRQKKTIWDAFSGAANRIYDELVSKGETPVTAKVLDMARMAVERDFECDLSGPAVVLKRSGESDKGPAAKKKAADAVKDAKKKDAKKEPLPDIGRHPSAQDQIDKTQFELLDELAMTDPAKFQKEMEKLPKQMLYAYTEWVPEPPANKGAQSA